MLTLKHEKRAYNSSDKEELSFVFEIQVAFDERGDMTWHIHIHIAEIGKTFFYKFSAILLRSVMVQAIRNLQRDLADTYGSITILRHTVESIIGGTLIPMELFTKEDIDRIISVSKLSHREIVLLKRRLI